MYPNEVELQWSVLIVLYPYLTGLVAGAFILASLERVFNVEAVKPTYRLALLTALAFLLVAPLPLQLHSGHPERSLEMYLTPHRSSAMAMFGFVYLWYLMVVLVLEIWLDYRRDIVLLSQTTLAVGDADLPRLDAGLGQHQRARPAHRRRVGWIVTVIGIPSAFLLHGYVGFIFGSVKANPWWSSPLMPVVFLFSAMVSGHCRGDAAVHVHLARAESPWTCACLDTMAQYLFYTFIIDFSLEMLDLIHRIYEADESFRSLDFMVHTRSICSQVVIQILLGTVAADRDSGACAGCEVRRPSPKADLYAGGMPLTMIGIFAMRWNVVIGGQLFSKSFLGYTTYKMGFITREGLLAAILLTILPFFILWALVQLLPPWRVKQEAATPPLAVLAAGRKE